MAPLPFFLFFLLFLTACSSDSREEETRLPAGTPGAVELKVVNGVWGTDGKTVGFFKRGTRVGIQAREDTHRRTFLHWEGPVDGVSSRNTYVTLDDQVGDLVVVRAVLRDREVMEIPSEMGLGTGERLHTGGLSLSPTNPRVFRYDDKAFPLFGSRNNYYAQDLGEIENDFRRRAKLGLNHFRFWADFRSYQAEQPWMRVPGKHGINGSPKLDLTKENDAYFERAKEIVELAARYGIIVHWMVFDEIELEQAKHRWGRNPFHPANNVNDLGLNSRTGACNGRGCFFDLENARLLAIQRSHVERLVRTLASSGNVTFAVMNESTARYDWEMYWVRLIRERGGIVLTNSFSEEKRLIASKGLHAFAFHNLRPARVNATFLTYYASEKHLTYEEQATRPARSEKDLLDIIWGALLAMGSYSFDEISKDEDLAMLAETFSGHAAFFYRDHVRHYEALEPANPLIRKGSGYGAACTGKEYIFFSHERVLELDLSELSPDQKVDVIWFDPASGQEQKGRSFRASQEPMVFTSPYPGASVLYLRN